MKSCSLRREGRAAVMVIFAGWAMDERPFRHLKTDTYDVIVYYDYRNITDVPNNAEVAGYACRKLLAWSFGCAAANAVALQTGWTFKRAVALNGTIIPESDDFGVSARLLNATARNLACGGWDKFVARMCPDEESRRVFDAGMPSRNLEELQQELVALRNLASPSLCVFDLALVGEKDRIIFSASQKRCWERYHVPVLTLACGHFPFHLWTRWEEIPGCEA